MINCEQSKPKSYFTDLSVALAQLLDPALSHYRDRRFPGNQEDFEQKLRESTTLYIGNLSFFTTEEQIYEVCVAYNLVRPPRATESCTMLERLDLPFITEILAGVLTVRRCPAHHHGSGQAQEDALRLLFCGVLHAQGRRGRRKVPERHPRRRATHPRGL